MIVVLVNRLVLPTCLMPKCYCTVGTDTGGWFLVVVDHLQRVYVVDPSRNTPERDTAWLGLAWLCSMVVDRGGELTGV